MPTNTDARQIENRNYPVVRPTLVLDFANSKCLDSRITFSRASVATRINESGLVELVRINYPRIDFDPISNECLGLLIEEQRTNFYTFSEQLDNAAWTKTRSTISANATTAPDGTLTADKLVEDGTASSTHFIHQNVTAALNQAWTSSAWVKASERTVVLLNILNPSATSNNVTATFNLSTGVISSLSNNGNATGAAATMVLFPNGWWRITLSGTADTSGTTVQSQLRLHNGSSTNYNGDSTSGVFVWGMQLETGAFATSYIPTTTTTTTRSADLATMTALNFSSWFKDTEGTFVAKAHSTVGIIDSTIAAANNTTQNEQVDLRITNVAYAGRVRNDGANVMSQVSSSLSAGAVRIGATTYGTTSNIATNGVVYTDVATPILPTITQLEIGRRASASWLNGHIYNLYYYPKRFTSDELRAITNNN